jgi:hypothetical protein
MPQFLGIRIRNYKSLKDVTLGQVGRGRGHGRVAVGGAVGVGAVGVGPSWMCN